MDYQKLNKQTVKNNYPLLLITELVDAMGNKRVFVKFKPFDGGGVCFILVIDNTLALYLSQEDLEDWEVGSGGFFD